MRKSKSQKKINWKNYKNEEELYNLLIKLYDLLSKEKQREFYRSLPFGDCFVDRWERAKKLKFGEGSSIYDSSLVLGNVTVGKNSWIGPFTILDGSGGDLIIGNSCDISAGVQIYTHDTINRVIYNNSINTASVTIGNNCYIGPNAIISKGISIGDKVVVGANSFVNRDLPSGCRAYGTPVKIFNEIE